jgi:hypothetical protein
MVRPEGPLIAGAAVDHAMGPSGGEPSEAAAVGASDRLRLEVDLLARPDEQLAATPTPAVSGRPPRAVLIAVGEPDLAEYTRHCLRTEADLLVIEPAAGEGPLAALRRMGPVLLITEPAVCGELPPALSVPVLLLVQEPGDATEIMMATSSPVFVLTQPFNARRMLAAVESLLGPGGNVQPP